MNTTEILNERGKTHGDFSDNSFVSQRLKEDLVHSKNFSLLSEVQREALDMICHKLARIVSGDPNVKDHWDDIAGYATLVSERIVEG